MQVKLFGDTQKIDWPALGVRMPFAPMHELAEKYELTPPVKPFKLVDFQYVDIERTLEIPFISENNAQLLAERVMYRMRNTVAALDTCSPESISINLGGGYHHAGKYPNTGYAYSLINDIIWAVDYQLEQGKTVGIIDLDFHFGGGTYQYYNQRISVTDHHHPKGILQKHVIEPSSEEDWQIHTTDTLDSELIGIPNADKILLNIGTDWFHDDPLFGKYGNMYAVPLIEVWMNTVSQILERKIPVAITMGGGYGSDGLQLYENFISCLQNL